MIRAEFYESKGVHTGFSVSGHAGYADAGQDVVCAAVSSAVQLTVNLLDALGCKPDVTIGSNVIRCKVKEADNTSDTIFRQLKLHFEAVLEEFPKTINITNSEV